MSQTSSCIIAQDKYVNVNPLPAVTDGSAEFPFDLLLKISYRMYKEDINKNEYIGSVTQKKRQQAN